MHEYCPVRYTGMYVYALVCISGGIVYWDRIGQLEIAANSEQLVHMNCRSAIDAHIHAYMYKRLGHTECVYMYTLSVKRNRTSLERGSLKSTTLILIIFWWGGGGGISSSVLSVLFTDKFALSQSDARISVAYNSCHWKTLTKRLMKCPPECLSYKSIKNKN